MLRKQIYFRQLLRQYSCSIKDYQSIPGPRSVPLVGNLWRYLPLIGDYRVDTLHLNAFKNQAEYGDLVRETIIGDHSILHVFDPQDIRIVLKNIGNHPLRRSHRALMKYRLDRPSKYNSGGLFPENGLVWSNLRKKLERLFMNAKNIKKYIVHCDQITNELIELTDHALDDKMEIDDFHNTLFRWSLENTAVLALDIRLGALKDDLSEELELLIKSTHDTHSAVIETESSSDLWKVIRTKSYRKLETAQENMYNILKKYFDKRVASKQVSDSMFNQMLNKSGLDQKDLFMTVIDLFLAGLDTTSFSSGFALYYLTQNQSAQSKLRTEISHLLGRTNGQFIEQHLNSIPYLKACVKETMRIQPVSIGMGRVTDQDLVLRNYRIPQGTMVILHNQVACKLAKNFSEPDKFMPERWLNGSWLEEATNHTGAINENWLNDENVEKVPQQCAASKIDPFLVLPFGFGRRVCLGRAFSEIEIYVLLAKLIYNYEISYEYDKIATLTRLINVPDKPMRFKFKKIRHH